MTSFRTSFDRQVLSQDPLTERQAGLAAAPFSPPDFKSPSKDAGLHLTGKIIERTAKTVIQPIEGVSTVETIVVIEEMSEVRLPFRPDQASHTTPTLPEARKEASWNITELYGYTVRAEDGDAGKVHDFYFNDKSWVICYLVVDLGDWLPDTHEWVLGQKVVVSARACSQRPEKRQVLSVTLPKKQIEISPNVATYRPFLDNLPLRSVKDVIGYRIQALDGEMGRVKTLIIDPRTWFIQMIVIEVPGRRLSKQIGVAPLWVDRVDLTTSTIYLNLSREFIKNKLKL